MLLPEDAVVELVRDLEDEDLYKGEQGKIIGYSEENKAYIVEMNTNRNSLHNCEGLVPSGKGIYLSDKELRLI